MGKKGRRSLKKIISIFVAAILLIGWTIYSHEQVGTAAGERAPDFELFNIAGENISLLDFQGKRVVLYFWATWCDPCRAGMPHKQEIYDQYHEQGIEIIAINLTQTERSKQHVIDYVKKERLTFPILLDQSGDISRMYQIQGTPTTYLIHSNGIIEEKIVGLMHRDLMEELILGLE